MHIMLNGFGGAVDNFCLSIQQVRREAVDNFGRDAHIIYYVKLVGEAQIVRPHSPSIPPKFEHALIILSFGRCVDRFQNTRSIRVVIQKWLTGGGFDHILYIS